MVDLERPMVSVCMITYNHEDYIAQAIEGVLMQRCNFRFELLIGEDCSTDATRLICERYSENAPDIIKLLPSEKNLGMMPNFIRTLQSCTGKYIALCEGDDYWTDALKLQKQVDFLETNSEFYFCFHNDFVFNEITGKNSTRLDQTKIDHIVNIRSAIIQNNCPTASILFRNDSPKISIPEWFVETAKGDYGLIILLSEKGLGKFIPETMSVYRLHTGGSWTGMNSENHFIENKKFYTSLSKYFDDNDLKELIKNKQSWVSFNYGLNVTSKGEFLKGLALIFRNCRFNKEKRLKLHLRKVPISILKGIYYRLHNFQLNTRGLL